MKSFALLALAALAALSPRLEAATANFVVKWNLPTKAMDGSALTGANSLTGVELYVDTKEIPNDSTLAAVAKLPATAITHTHTVSDVAVGTKFFFRVKARNGAGLSGFSGQVTATAKAPASKPAAPDGAAVTVTVTIT